MGRTEPLGVGSPINWGRLRLPRCAALGEVLGTVSGPWGAPFLGGCLQKYDL